MSEQTKPRRFQKLWDAILVASVSSIVGTVIAGIAFFVFQQVYSAQNQINIHQMELKHLRDDLTTTQDLLAEELAPIKAWLREYDMGQDLREEVEELKRDLEERFNAKAHHSIIQQTQ